MITVRRQGGFIQIHDNRDRLPENVSKAKYCIKQVENCKKKKCLENVAQKAKKCSNSAQKSIKCSRVLEM